MILAVGMERPLPDFKGAFPNCIELLLKLPRPSPDKHRDKDQMPDPHWCFEKLINGFHGYALPAELIQSNGPRTYSPR